MQDHDWDDLRLVLALHRAGTLSAAARTCGVSETTVARRLKRLESALSIPVFFRSETGRFDLTEAGGAVLHHAAAIERENAELRDRLDRISGRLTGTVRISAVPLIINHVLLPRLPELMRHHPDLSIELVPEQRNVDLTKHEADLAVRFARPHVGGHSVRARKLGDLAFEVYAATTTASEAEGQLVWIEYEDGAAALPQARWSETHREQCGGAASSLRVADMESALGAALCGFGRAILPKMACLGDHRLRAVDSQCADLKMTREVWLLSHADHHAHRSVLAAKDWLTGMAWE